MTRDSLVRLGAVLACALTAAGCSGTVEASYRPPPPPPPSPPPITAPPSIAVPTTVPALVCGPDRVSVQVGDVQVDASTRAVPLLLRVTGPLPCQVGNPVDVELLDEAGEPIRGKVVPTDLPPGRRAIDQIPLGDGAMLWLQWRVEPSQAATDAAKDCVRAKSLRIGLTRTAPPIPVDATVAACDGGTLYVSPAEAASGSGGDVPAGDAQPALAATPSAAPTAAPSAAATTTPR